MQQVSLEISDPELAGWLSSLNASIWQSIVYDDKFGSRDATVEKRKLSSEEWDKVKKVISSGDVMLTIGDSMGLTLYVSIWSFPVSVFEDEPVRLLTICNHHIEQMKTGLNGGEGLWDIIYPYTHSESNKLNVQGFLQGQHIGERDEYSY